MEAVLEQHQRQGASLPGGQRLILALATALAQAQPAHADAFERGLAVERRHMVVLGGWAGANLVGGALGVALADTPPARTFHGTNAAWNVVNLGIAAAGSAGVAQRARSGPSDLATVERQHRNLRTALAVNLGLDAIYVGTGAVTWGAGGDARSVDVASMGRSLVLQGAFLAVFDAMFLARHRAATRAFRR